MGVIYASLGRALESGVVAWRLKVKFPILELLNVFCLIEPFQRLSATSSDLPECLEAVERSACAPRTRPQLQW